VTKRIVHIIPSLDRAGAEKQMALLLRDLPRNELDLHVCAMTRGGALEADLHNAGVPVTVIGKRWKVDPLAYRRLRSYLREMQPDLVHTWLFAANAYGRAAARSVGVKHTVAGERCVDLWKTWYQWEVDRRLAPATDRIVVNSPAIRDYSVELGLPAEKFLVIPGAVESPPPSDVTRPQLCAELGEPEDAQLIGAVGRLWPQKRVKDLIWAFELMHVLDDRARLLVIGDGPQRRMLERFARSLELDHAVLFLGHREDVLRIMPHLDVLWLGSDYEGLPNAVMEAMACGVPVVATDIPGCRELVTEDETGFLVPVAGRAERARQTDKILRDPELARRLGQAGREKVSKEFTVERMVKSHFELYREILNF